MIAPAKDPRAVAEFDEAFYECVCPLCGGLLLWQPAEGIPHQDAISEAVLNEDDVLIWFATCCSVQWRLQWSMQRASDHTTPYGYVLRLPDGDTTPASGNV